MPATSGGRRRRAGNLLAAGAGALLTLGGLELAVRLLWSDAPLEVSAGGALPLQQVRDPKILYRLVPGSRGHYNGTPVSVNSLGLRDREIATPPPAGEFRVLVLGDSMTFGVGLPPEETLPGQLSRMLAPVQVVNGGVFGYNLDQEISLLRDVGPRIGARVVLSSFVHNDIDNWGVSEEGAVPEIRSSRFNPPPADAWSTRLADLLLPAPFDPDRLNLLPGPGTSGGVRAALAARSRLYLFAYLRLRTHSWNLTGGERRDELVDTPSCRSEQVVWEPLRSKYRQLSRMAGEAGARFAVIIQGGLLWEGGPLRRFRSILAQEGIPHIDLTPVWLSPQTYAKEHSLGWDPHPNARANRKSAALIASYLRSLGWLPSRGEPPDGSRAGAQPGGVDAEEILLADPALARRVVEWRERQAGLIAAEEAAWRATSASFLSSVQPGSAAPEIRRQLLYGFWPSGEAGPTGAPPFTAGSGLWMCSAAGVLLKPQAGASRVVVQARLPEEPPAMARAPRWIGVSLSLPAARCGVTGLQYALEEAAQRPGEAPRRSPGQRFRFSLPIPRELAGSPLLEVGLEVDRTFPATHLRPSTRDPRLISLIVESVSAE